MSIVTLMTPLRLEKHSDGRTDGRTGLRPSDKDGWTLNKALGPCQSEEKKSDFLIKRPT